MATHPPPAAPAPEPVSSDLSSAAPRDSAPSSAVLVRPAGPGELDAVARVRARCYASRYEAEADFRTGIAQERASAAEGDFLLAERRGRLVGTATCLRGEMSIRGRVLPCQGVAYVGTTHDTRRRGGVATAIMRRALDVARERGEVLSALVPFRTSFYEHFGYGLIERRLHWTLPTALLPHLPEDVDVRLLDPGDAADVELARNLRRRQFEAGHGDMDFPASGGFDFWMADLGRDGYLFTGERDGQGVFLAGCQAIWVTPDGRIATKEHSLARRAMLCQFAVYEDLQGLAALLGFLGTLRDQYAYALIGSPADLPLNLLMKESQVSSREQHAHATCSLITRLQVRVLDHVRLLDDSMWPDAQARGRVEVAIRECEGSENRVRLEVSEGRCAATTGRGGADFTCRDVTWAAIALGELRASTALGMGLAEGTAEAAALLDGLSCGPAPFCREYF